MYKKAWCTCKVVVLRNKPIAFLTSWLPSPSSSSLLKLPITLRRERKHCFSSTNIWKRFPLAWCFAFCCLTGLLWEISWMVCVYTEKVIFVRLKKEMSASLWRNTKGWTRASFPSRWGARVLWNMAELIVSLSWRLRAMLLTFNKIHL